MANEAKHTPGPWRWFGSTKTHDLYLATEDRGRVFVMDFVRWGTGNAQPRFQSADHFMNPASALAVYEVAHRRDITGLDHPDARLIAAAPDLLEAARDARALMQSVAPHPLAQALLQRIEAAIAKAEGR